MAFIASNNVLLFEPVYSLPGSGEKAINTLYLHSIDAWDNTRINTLFDDAEDWLDESLCTFLSEDMSVSGFYARDLTAQDGLIVERTFDTPKPGTVTAGLNLPVQNAGCLSLRTVQSGRSGRGRIYLPGLRTGSLQTPTTFNASFISGYHDIFEAFETMVLAQDAVWVVLSRYHNGAARASGVPYNITAFHIDTRVCTQRRRLPSVVN